MARQRFRFLARLFVAAGYEGWVLLFDEVELIGRYTLLQRGRSYAELAGWLHPDPDDPASPLAAGLAITDDFDAAVLTAKNDREVVPTRLRAKQTAEWDAAAEAAEAAMAAITRDMLLLQAPDADEIDHAYRRVRSCTRGLRLDGTGRGRAGAAGTTRMRQYVRAWINEWDLVRLDPAFRPHSEVTPVTFSYAEQPELDPHESEQQP